MAPATIRRAPYKDFLQPALQRRFSTTAIILAVISYIEAVFLANWDSYFWSWFPVGPTGLRAFFLFFCGLAIIILRIAQYHVGLRTSNSPFQTFTQNALKPQTAEAIFSYVVSGWLFSQVYLWSVSSHANLDWITYYSGDRARLNEKPLFLTTHFVIYGVLRALLHLFRDTDRLVLGTVRHQTSTSTHQTSGSANQIRRFADNMPALIINSITESLVATLLSLVVYALFVRHTAWRIALLVFRPFYNLPKTNMVPLSMPYSLWLIVRCIFASILISFLWVAGNAAFSLFLVSEPIKNGKPLTSESKDANGSLLNGLKSKKMPIRTFAMWELAFIARDFDSRRKAIYEDIDRKDGPMWSQIYGICLETVKSIETRIDNYGKPPAPTAAPTTADQAEGHKRVSQPLKEDPILISTPQSKTLRSQMERAVSRAATDPSQSSRLSPVAKKAVADARGKLAAVQKELSSPENNGSPLQMGVHRLLQSPLGWPFRQEFRQRFAAAVLGTPQGEAGLYVNAIYALSQLAVHSLTEDKFGNVQRDVASIIRSLTSVARKLEAFKSAFSIHWTDLSRDRSCPEVDAIVEALQAGLTDLITNFGPYSRDLRLSQTDMRLAKEAAGAGAAGREEKATEMQQIR
ncbi:uncharacterized protein E0L32_007347 [Thyridium curvatum]|uniref:Nuclear envelope protein n=1 Tax=Thyridium curvatum TaxID=1093900 RepID=A0A507B3G2_9PEZI|nr:uncharacterized protein E0L32_007347 [Thyridium curvatum]TPX11849.1 hypothetical protein E0L32_007347 [Thyridium curvatum]